MYGVRLVCSFGTSYLRNHICSCFFTSLSLFRLSESMIYNYFYVFFRLCFGNWFISNLFADISNGVEFVQWAYICWRIYKIAVNYILATHTESNRTRTHTFKIWLLTSAKRANNTASYGCFLVILFLHFGFLLSLIGYRTSMVYINLSICLNVSVVAMIQFCRIFNGMNFILKKCITFLFNSSVDGG